ncbi:MAG: hypothetical protein V2J25_10280 [Desulfatiglans sp.]|nr:hypothetical protein [Thermodesulfobacteriota bacterium]MEE4353245.1 hypothetical protein [Desulfatiglans sp.]
MSLTDFLNIVPGYPVVSVVIWMAVAIVMLYLARSPAHRTIKSFSSIIRNGMRLASKSVMMIERRLSQRNKEVLLAEGREAVERSIEREFQRVNAVVNRDLSTYPALQLVLSEQITHIDEDYRESAELPPPPPTWTNAVKAIAKIPFNDDTTVATIFKEIHKTINRQYKDAMDEYRRSMGVRHGLLRKMMPYWRKLEKTLDEVGKTITGLQERSRVIDSRMDEYEAIRARTDESARTLSSSSMTQFFISALVLLIAIGGAIINFNLIALPMSEMVGGGSYIGQFKTSNVAALVIILVEVAMGLYLMESLRITKLFPMIGSMDDKMRRRMIWITFSILFILAGVESALAFMRDRIATDMQALRQSLSTAEEIEVVTSWIPTVGQMVMGFILPFALTFVAIPLESFINSSRTVIGVFLVGILRWVAFLLRLAGNIAAYTGELLVNIYDLCIFPPLWVEKVIQGRGHQTEMRAQEEVT